MMSFHDIMFGLSLVLDEFVGTTGLVDEARESVIHKLQDECYC
jgi:hypothetical protein